jgi:hypothetical protein
MNEKRQAHVACDHCGKELEDYAWVDIHRDCERTYCEACAWHTHYMGCVLMRGFKTHVGYIEHLFERWLVDRFAQGSEE